MLTARWRTIARGEGDKNSLARAIAGAGEDHC